MVTAEFSTVVEKERERLTNLRADTMARRATIDAEIAAIDKEIAAIDAYQQSKKGRGAKRNSSGRRGSRQSGILELLGKRPEGMTRGEILEAFDVKGDAAGEQAVSNALANMKRTNKVVSGAGGRYLLA